MAKLGSWILIAFIILALCAELEASKSKKKKQSPSGRGHSKGKGKISSSSKTAKKPSTRFVHFGRSSTGKESYISVLFKDVKELSQNSTKMKNGLSQMEKLLSEANSIITQTLQLKQQENNDLITSYTLVKVFMEAKTQQQKDGNMMMLIDLKPIINTDTSTLSILQKMMPQSPIDPEKRVMHVSLEDYQRNVAFVSMTSTLLLKKLRKLAEKENDPEMRNQISTLHLTQDHIRDEFLDNSLKQSMIKAATNPISPVEMQQMAMLQHTLFSTLGDEQSVTQPQIPTIHIQSPQEVDAMLSQSAKNGLPGASPVIASQLQALLPSGAQGVVSNVTNIVQDPQQWMMSQLPFYNQKQIGF